MTEQPDLSSVFSVRSTGDGFGTAPSGTHVTPAMRAQLAAVMVDAEAIVPTVQIVASNDPATLSPLATPSVTQSSGFTKKAAIARK